MADMIGLAIKLSDAGVGDYWEDVDQYVRNQFVEAQFIRADLLERISASSPEHVARPPMETDVDVIERCVGSFGGPRVTNAGFGAGGCCTGNCTQALYAAWEGIVRYHDGAAQVNLLLNRASPWLDVDSYLPYEGKVVLHNKMAETVRVRIPYAVDKAAVRCQLNEAEASSSWLGNYLMLAGLAQTDVITIEFPLVVTTETYRLGDTRYTCDFKGNTLIDVSPRDQRPTVYPIYVRDHYKADQAPMKTVERYVSQLVIRW